MNTFPQNNYQTKSPVLFIIFSRPDTTAQVFAAIRIAQPKRLYIAADGPRIAKQGEDKKCAETRDTVLAAIDWECEVKTLFRENNLGPKEAISSAIDWFFDNETEGIILEHDCLPANSFFMFCDAMLEKYRYDTRIWLISGSNLTNKKWGDASYYFSNLTNGWGWATWKRSWALYDKSLAQYKAEDVRQQLEKIFDDPLIVDTWEHIFKDTKAGKIDTWDYQITFSHLFNHCVNIVSNNNLVSNIGFGELAENTVNAESIFAAIPLETLTEINHPQYLLPEKEADRLTLWEEFDLEARYKRHNKLKNRFKRWIKGHKG
ncbi:nucleotide-diphospho-sugar transferase [Mucilaginibacter polytrichastri]|uniref:Nucleotide-diphospho-sugar transferase n=1 Tax=Mucilaginibacter polytrichastri TaxID=1302689 RepID=A0A1Q6A5Q3_9SPHI|nr:nucleotide-diphospho-sugar transferase [Mucilaginibacter polytrichastri]OKS89326.1 hypothetical protein RG47T_4810 [Mucilaginibacter polytrichastri]SFS74483.1 hypothetical protein SAMN04487890_103279 [Mucilaginibacter polytrichastri]